GRRSGGGHAGDRGAVRRLARTTPHGRAGGAVRTRRVAGEGVPRRRRVTPGDRTDRARSRGGGRRSGRLHGVGPDDGRACGALLRGGRRSLVHRAVAQITHRIGPGVRGARPAHAGRRPGPVAGPIELTTAHTHLPTASTSRGSPVGHATY